MNRQRKRTMGISNVLGKLLFGILFLSWQVSTLSAQVTIGSGIPPEKGALLDLKQHQPTDKGITANMGLLLPRVYLTETSELYPMLKDDPGYTAGDRPQKLREDVIHTGLCVYNTSQEGDFYPGVYVWDGEKWGLMGNPPCTPVQSISITGPDKAQFTQTPQTFTARIEGVADDTNFQYQWYVTMPGQTIEAPVGEDNKTLTFVPNLVGEYTFRCEVTELCDYPKPKSAKHKFICEEDIDEYIDDQSGKAILRGKSCFDVVLINDGGEHGTLQVRDNQRTDFRQRGIQDPSLGGENDQLPGGAGGIPPEGSSYRYTGVQVYTLTASAKVNLTDLRFLIDDFDGLIEKIDPNVLVYPGELTEGQQKITIYYKSDLNDQIKGLSREDAKRVRLIALYKADGVKMRTKLEMTFQDACCCGAYIDGGKWLTFMCHNLGADERVDPLVPGQMLMGDYFQFGNSANKGIAFYGGAAKTVHLKTPYSKGGWKGTTSSLGGDYYRPKSDNDWKETGTEDHPVKGAGDPCPCGWRMPTQSEWVQLLNPENNVFRYAGVSSGGVKTPLNGMYIGNNLFLPSCGYADWYNATKSPAVSAQGTDFGYWSSTWSSSGTAGPYIVWGKMFKMESLELKPASAVTSGRGYAIRCVADNQD